MAEIYKNAPLIEALCEFHFSQEQEWDWTIPGTIYEMVKGDFPVKSQQKGIKVIIDGKTGKATQSDDSTVEKVRFFRDDQSALLQVGPHILSVNQLLPYPGWEKFKDLILSSLQIYIDVADPAKLEKVGLRYINRFERTDANLFLIKPYIPINKPIKNYFMRNELYYKEVDSNLIIIMGNQYDQQNDQNFTIIDLEFYSTNQHYISFKSYNDWLETAHNCVEEAFESCISKELKLYLRGE